MLPELDFVCDIAKGIRRLSLLPLIHIHLTCPVLFHLSVELPTAQTFSAMAVPHEMEYTHV